MQVVTFSEIVPGMVLRPIEDVNSPRDNAMIIVMEVIPEGTDKFWGDSRALKFIPSYDAYSGACYSAWRTDDACQWEVIDSQEILDGLRATVKKVINEHRDHLDETERFVDANL